jgi:hypothetical protein
MKIELNKVKELLDEQRREIYDSVVKNMDCHIPPNALFIERPARDKSILETIRNSGYPTDISILEKYEEKEK